MIVIDTHALVWFVEGDARLGSDAIAIIDRERARSGAGIARITAWEMAMLVDRQRLAIGFPTQR